MNPFSVKICKEIFNIFMSKSPNQDSRAMAIRPDSQQNTAA
jgi:hypothetical protein